MDPSSGVENDNDEGRKDILNEVIANTLGKVLAGIPMSAALNGHERESRKEEK